MHSNLWIDPASVLLPQAVTDVFTQRRNKAQALLCAGFQHNTRQTGNTTFGRRV